MINFTNAILNSILLGLSFTTANTDILMDNIVKQTLDAPNKPEISEVVTNISNPKSPYNTINMRSAIMDKNLLYVTGFEDSDMEISYKNSNFPPGHNREFGGHTKIDYDKSDGFYSTRVEDSYNNGNYDNGYNMNGNHLGYQDYTVMKSVQRLFLPDNSKVSVTADVKVDTETTFASLGIGGTIDTPKPWGDRIFLENSYKGDTTIKISGLTEHIKNRVESGHKYYIVLNKTTTGAYSTGNISSVNLVENTITLTSGLKEEFSKGDYVLIHEHVNPVNFPKITVNKLNEWFNFQMNTTVDSSKYTTSKRGITFWWQTITHGTAFIDNIRFGYANKLHLYRDDNLIYEGYDLTYKDSSVKDLNPPQRVDTIQSDIIIKNDNTNLIRVNIPNIEDIGTDYSYTLKASYDNVKSMSTEPYISNIKTGLDGFSYIIDNNPLTIPDNTVDLRTNYIEQEIPKNDNIYYLHIKSIDKAGNISNTTHIKLEAFKTTVNTLVNENGVNLSWDLNSNINLNDVYFKVFRKNINSETYEEISSKTKDLSFIDRTALDTEKPNIPTILNSIYLENGNSVEYEINKALDNSTRYQYYIEMFKESDNSKISKSNIEEVSIESGIEGIYYKIDTSSNSEVLTSVKLVNNILEIPLTNIETYLHIKAVDNNNNESETAHLKISDNELPAIDLRLSEYLPTNKNITIVATGNDNIAIDYILKPDKTKEYSNALTYEVSKNGIYEFEIYDKAGNKFNKSITVTNIDREVDSISITKSKNIFTKDNVTIKVRANDKSGINYIILPDGTKTFESNVDFEVSKDGIYKFTIRDNANNEQVYSVEVNNIDKVIPSVTINKENNWTNKGVQLNINTRD